MDGREVLSTTPIADHALLSDCHSTGLVDRNGSVEWLTFPRFDSPSIFGRLLDENAGYFSIHPVDPYRVTRRYLPESLVLETTFHTDSGVLTLTDALALGSTDRGHALGAHSPHVLLRSVRCQAGSVRYAVDYRPRPEHGLIVPRLREYEGGVAARGGAESLVLSTPVPLRVEEAAAIGVGTLSEGQVSVFALDRSTLEEPEARVWSQAEIADLLESTIADWRSWSELHQRYEGPWRDLVWRSGVVLRGLTFQPSGAVVAAATTSLPEVVGGERNWDYRYAWVRDASMTMQALWVSACPDEAEEFFRFVTTAAGAPADPHTDLRVLFGVGGEHDLSERELRMTGWRDSRPVRAGNDAWTQRQHDGYGVLGAASRLVDYLGDMDEATSEFLTSVADWAMVRWPDPDNGIWEVRGEPRHFMYSKVMCWVALDRAIAIADVLRARHRVADWERCRDEIRETVLREGWNERVGSFTQYFGSDEPDASLLMLPLVGFIAGDDPRMLATIKVVEERLGDGTGLVYRYRPGTDGLPGREGPFLICSFWLSQALALAGRLDRAKEVFERAAGFVNDVGLLAEEVDPDTGEQLGNFPQAFSHIGLANAAWVIAERDV